MNRKCNYNIEESLFFGVSSLYHGWNIWRTYFSSFGRLYSVFWKSLLNLLWQKLINFCSSFVCLEPYSGFTILFFNLLVFCMNLVFCVLTLVSLFYLAMLFTCDNHLSYLFLCYCSKHNCAGFQKVFLGSDFMVIIRIYILI